MKKNLLLVLLSVVAILVMAIPVLAQGATNLTGFYMAKMPTKVYAMDGDKVTYNFTYYGLDLTSTNETVAGYIYGFNASSVLGCKVRAGTSDYDATLSDNSEALTFGAMNITATSSSGLVGVYIKSGCDGTATNGTGSITGSPVSLAPGWNTLNVTGNGTITLYTWMPYELLATIDGISGEGSSAYFLLAGTSFVTGLDEGDATITGVDGSFSIIPPGFNFTVTGNGTVTIDMEPGNYGSASGESLTVNGEASVDLDVGANTLVLSAAPGNLVVEVSTFVAYQFNGKFKNPFWGADYLSGILTGFIVTSNDPWDANIFYNTKVKASKLTDSPLLD